MMCDSCLSVHFRYLVNSRTETVPHNCWSHELSFMVMVLKIQSGNNPNKFGI